MFSLGKNKKLIILDDGEEGLFLNCIYVELQMKMGSLPQP
jgi:hypothetical protein